MSFLSKVFHWLGKEEEGSFVDLPPPVMVMEGSSRKRSRDTGEKPALGRTVGREDDSPRPTKLFRGSERVIPINPPSILESLPEDVLSRCLAFAGGVEDRFAVQTTCQQFRRISNQEENLKLVDVENIVTDDDSVESALKKLTPFAESGNLKALYMYVRHAIPRARTCLPPYLLFLSLI